MAKGHFFTARRAPRSQSGTPTGRGSLAFCKRRTERGARARRKSGERSEAMCPPEQSGRRPVACSPPRKTRSVVSVVMVPLVLLGACVVVSFSSSLPIADAFVVPQRILNEFSSRRKASSSSSTRIGVVPLKTDTPPPYRPRYRPQDDDASRVPASRQPGRTEDGDYYTSNVPPFSRAPSSSFSSEQQRVTLTRFLSDAVRSRPDDLADIESLLLAVQMACKTISHLVNRAGINQLGMGGIVAASKDAVEQRDFRLNSMRRLDQLSTNVLRNALRFTGKLQMVAPARDVRDGAANAGADGGGDADGDGAAEGKESKKKKEWPEDVAEVMDEYGPAAHQPGVLIAKALDGRYAACLDPLDGSGNADAAICTGTVFGVFETPHEEEGEEKGREGEGGGSEGDDEEARLVRSVLQPGRNLRAAGYCLYSSATVLVMTVGDGTHGFTLDPQIDEFVLTYPDMKVPPRGNVYSCNEANSEGWDDDLRSYLRALKTGKGETKTRYALRYVGSMVGDIHRTLMYGGIFCYPSDSGVHPRGNLQLLYKIAPMAYVMEQAGGRSSDGRRELLDVVPKRVHERSPCFIGSPDDVEEMKTYVKHEE